MAIFHLKKNVREIAYTDAEDAPAAKESIIRTNPQVPEHLMLSGLIPDLDII